MAKIEQVPPPLDLEVVAGDPLSFPITVIGAVVTSPVITMKTAGGDPYTTDPGVGSASMTSADVCTPSWSAADTAALNTATRPISYRWSLSAVVNGTASYQLLARTLTVLPVGSARRFTPSPTELTINLGTTIDLALTVASTGWPGIDGGAPDEVFLDGIDGGAFDAAYTDTTYDGGTI
jgi:hypothetical protein